MTVAPAAQLAEGSARTQGNSIRFTKILNTPPSQRKNTKQSLLVTYDIGNNLSCQLEPALFELLREFFPAVVRTTCLALFPAPFS